MQPILAQSAVFRREPEDCSGALTRIEGRNQQGWEASRKTFDQQSLTPAWLFFEADFPVPGIGLQRGRRPLLGSLPSLPWHHLV